MKKKNLKKNLLIYMFLFGILIGLTIIPNYLGTSKASGNDENETTPDAYIENRTIHSKQMIRDPNFDLEQSSSPWIINEEGDISDIDGNIDNKKANYEVIGDTKTFNINGTINSANWTEFANPEYPVLPDNYFIDSHGIYVNHTWDEGDDQTRNTPSIQWKQNISMPVDMSDYKITSASVESLFNATVTTGPLINGIDVLQDTNITQMATGDYVTFYILISDLENNKVYRIAYNKTTNLGQNLGIEIPSIVDTLMTNVNEDVLIFYLTSVLETDHKNFTITIGVDIYCEDNYYSADIDIWNDLRIKTFNLTFAYEKKIDQLTSASWNQVGNKINNNEYELGTIGFFIIHNASLNFDYHISKVWPTSVINSEIRVYINNFLHSKTIKLTDFSTAVQHESFDIDPSKLGETQNITLKLQLFIADNFNLSKVISLSIDNVNLTTSFTVVERNIPIPTVLETIPTFVFYIMGVVILGLAASFIAYQQYFRFPKTIREIKSLGKAIRKGKAAEKELSAKMADDLFVEDYKSKTKGLLPSKSQAILKDRGAPGSGQKSIAKGDVKKGIKGEKTGLKETKIEEKQKITPDISKKEIKPEISKKPSMLEDSLELPKAEQPIKAEPTQKIEKLKADQFVKPHNIEDSDLKQISMDRKPKKIRYLRKPKIKELPKKKTDKK